MVKMQPMVLCINKSVFNHYPLDPFNQKGIFDFDLWLVNEQNFHFLNRTFADSKDVALIGLAENFPQVLPYLIMRNEKGEYLVYPRGKSGGESRLNDKLSLGFGGHIDLEDCVNSEGHINDTIERAADRELFEELDVPYLTPIEGFKHVIIDRTNDVGRVHVGFPQIIEVSSKEVTASNEIPYVEWLSLDEIKTKLTQFENWSQIVIENLL